MVDGTSSEFLLSPGPSSARDAREALSKVIHGESAALLERAVQLIGELAASLEGLHATGGDDRISVKVLSAGGTARVEIKDHGTGTVLGGLRTPLHPSSHGWSPHLLSRVADRWGLVSSVDGAWVWFELEAPLGGADEPPGGSRQATSGAAERRDPLGRPTASPPP
jgi:hypothetical protein